MDAFLFILEGLKSNWKSGLAVSLVSLPLAVSLAVVSGVTPVEGIITAVWAGFFGAFFGGSNYNIIGPTGALSGIIAAYVTAYGSSSASTIALLAGIFILIFSACKLEKYIVFIPSSVIHGFTLGVACIIISNQLNFALGLRNLPKHEHLIENLIESLKHLHEACSISSLLFLFFLSSLLVLRKLLPKIPGAIVLSPLGIFLGYATTHHFLPLPIETLGSKFGTIVPRLIQFPSFTFYSSLLMPSAVIAFIAIIETMVSAKIADRLTKTRYNPHKEILGLGLANIASGLAGGFPATAALARTALNIKTGATSKLSAVLSSILIVVASFLFFSYFSYMPLVVIAAILVHVSINLIVREHFYRLYRHDKFQFFVSLLVALITMYEDPIIGILLGVVITLLSLMNKIAQSYYEVGIHEGKNASPQTANPSKNKVLSYTFKGKLVYLNSQAHILQIQADFGQYAGIVLVLSDVYFIDLDGIDAVEEIVDLIEKRGQKVGLILTSYLKNMLRESPKYQELQAKGCVFASLDEAIQKFTA